MLPAGCASIMLDYALWSEITNIKKHYQGKADEAIIKNIIDIIKWDYSNVCTQLLTESMNNDLPILVDGVHSYNWKMYSGKAANARVWGLYGVHWSMLWRRRMWTGWRYRKQSNFLCTWNTGCCRHYIEYIVIMWLTVQ